MFFLTQSDASALFSPEIVFVFQLLMNSTRHFETPEIWTFQVRIGEVKTYMEKGLLLMVRFAQLNWRWHMALA